MCARINYSKTKERQRKRKLDYEHGGYNIVREATRVAKLEKLAGRPRPIICEIPNCGSTKKICFDHDHKTNEFRGWICDNCNKALGHVKDRIEILENLIVYLRNNNENTSSGLREHNDSVEPEVLGLHSVQPEQQTSVDTMGGT